MRCDLPCLAKFVSVVLMTEADLFHVDVLQALFFFSSSIYVMVLMSVLCNPIRCPIFIGRVLLS